MKLHNRFDEADKIRIWVDHPFCVLCGSNQNCSLHHIDGCKLDMHRSIYNSVMLCETHHQEADGMNTASPLSAEYRTRLRRITFDRIERIGHSKTRYDTEYLAHHKTHSR